MIFAAVFLSISKACAAAFRAPIAQEKPEVSDTRHKGQEIMRTRKNPGRGGSGSARRISSSPDRLRLLLALPAAIAAAAALVACSSAGASPGSSTSSPAAAAAGTVKTATIAGVTVLTNSKGFTLYSFAPDTPSTSKCYGSCAAYWPPVTGTAPASPSLPGRIGTITRTGGTRQLTYNGHPLYTYIGDTAPGQANGNNLNLNGGLWHEVRVAR
jgi:predicted lipoprotein with Yx(FWY)xxD motif